MARVHEDLRRRVIELRGVHRPDDGDVVGVLRQSREEIAHDLSRLPMRPELEGGAEQSRSPLNEGEPLAGDQLLRNRLSVVLVERRFGIEEIELRWAPGHEEVDDPLGLGGNRDGERRLPRPFREGGQRHPANSKSRLLEEMATRHRAPLVLDWFPLAGHCWPPSFGRLLPGRR